MFHNLIYYTDTPVVSPDFCNDLIHKFELDTEKHQGLTTSIGLDYTQMTDEQKQRSLSVKRSTDLYITGRNKYELENSILFGATSKTLDEYAEQKNKINYYILLSIISQILGILFLLFLFKSIFINRNQTNV